MKMRARDFTLLTCVAAVTAALGTSTGCSSSSSHGSPDEGADSGTPTTEGGQPTFTFSPTNVSLATITAQSSTAADENVSSNCNVQTDASSPDDDCFTSPIVAVKQEDGSTVDLVVVLSLQVQSTASINVTGGVPLVLVSLSDLSLSGNIQANSSSTSLVAGPGGAPGASSDVAGSGPGGGVAASTSSAVGASGGSYCGVGGAGGGASQTGAAYGSATIRPLVGGSAGGGGTVGSGAGGGGIQLVAAGALTIASGAYVNVGGEGGPFGGIASDQNSGGGGSGGSILVESPTVTIAGTLAANGGGGGGDYANPAGSDGAPNATPAPGAAAGSSEGAGGAGGAGATIDGGAGAVLAGGNAGAGGGGTGRIRINSTSGAATLTGATLSPATTTACATQGTLRTIAQGS